VSTPAAFRRPFASVSVGSERRYDSSSRRREAPLMTRLSTLTRLRADLGTVV
jgi:hypothetical protein